MDGASAKSASQRGKLLEDKLGSGGLYRWDFSAVPHGIMFEQSRLHQQVRLDPYREGAAELGLDSSFYMGVHVKNVDRGQERCQAHVCVILNG